MTRLTRAWGALAPEQRLAAGAALALLVTMFFPWYDLQSLNRKTGAINSHSISAFGDVSFVEAAVFLVAAGVIALMFARAERKDFHMPGSDGAVVMAAGAWATLLIFYRVFSRPSGHGYPVGIEWGFLLAFLCAGVLTYAGWRMHAASTPEAPLRRGHRRSGPGPRPSREWPATERTAGEPLPTERLPGARLPAEPPPEQWPPTEPPPTERPLASEDLTVVAPSATRHERSTPVPARINQPPPGASPVTSPSAQPPQGTPPSPPKQQPRVPRKRPRFPPAPSDQLSFEDPAYHSPDDAP